MTQSGLICDKCGAPCEALTEVDLARDTQHWCDVCAGFRRVFGDRIESVEDESE